ncbi:MAG: hypothetical protein A2W29_06795 [Gemmatimonadetes bacterium RBG_16_66_8]|nr:MAG: hypothetical protein A2W29_06795 [Gemmatimonadetes bacterium RBG_16_66_8]
MRGELAGSQISALLEAVPGIANVLRNPVADAIVNMIRAGARIGEFRIEDGDELVEYAVRRSMIRADEGERLLAEVRQAIRPKRASKSKTRTKRQAKRSRASASRKTSRPKKESASRRPHR